MKLEFSASVGFIHKESLRMQGHTILKFSNVVNEVVYKMKVIAQKKESVLLHAP